jgi:hypothetical protein
MMFFSFTFQKICIPWSRTSLIVEKSNNTAFFKIESSNRNGWTGIGFSSQRNPSLNSSMIYFTTESFKQFSNHDQNMTCQFFKNVNLVENLNFFLNDQKSITFEIDLSNLLNQTYLFFAEEQTRKDSFPLHSHFGTKQINLLEGISRDSGDFLLKFTDRPVKL